MWVQVPLSLIRMKIKNKILLDVLKRNIYNKTELATLIIKLISTNQILNFNLRNQYAQSFINWLVYSNKFKKTCIFTSRMRGNITMYKINRTKFKNLINNNYISGIKNASW